MRSPRDVAEMDAYIVQRLRAPSSVSCVSDGTASSSSRTRPRCGASLHVVQHGLVGLCHRASQPVHFKKQYRVSGPPATTLLFTGLVKVANADPGGDFLLSEAKRAARNYSGGLMASVGFLPVSRVTSELRLQRVTASPTLWIVHWRESHLLGILVLEEAKSQRPVEALHDALVPVDVNPTAPSLDRLLRQQLTDRAHELTAGST